MDTVTGQSAQGSQDQLILSTYAEKCTFPEFIMEQNRVPTVAERAWEYRGWLLYYRLLYEDMCEPSKRWSYWQRTMEAGHVLDEEIPRIEFGSGGERSDGYKHFNKLVEIVEREGRGWSSFTDLLQWMLYGFALSKELPKFSDELHEKLYRTLNLELFLKEPSDYIGSWIADRHGNGWNPNAFFPTPHEVCEMMVRMQMSGASKTDTVNDPAAGTGRMLLHASNYSLRLYACDIDQTVLYGLKINGALYAPWLVKPFPEEFFNEAKHD